jgi:hypothetical protein
MMKLIAMRPVLYAGRTYERGDALPAHDTKMVEAWLRAGSAAWDGQKTCQDGGNGQGGQEPGGGEKPGQDGQKAPEDGKNEQGGGEPDMVTGHLDPEQLERMSKADLLDLAEKLGVDVSEAKNNTERARLIAAVEVQAPANDPENDGGAQ